MSLNRVLVVDDEESLRWVLSKALSRLGLTVDLADCGEAARRLLTAGGYDLVLLDIKMPDVSGLDLLEEIRKKLPRLPVIMMTAESSMKNAVEAMKRGAYDYITKPFDLDALEALVIKAKNFAENQAEVTRLHSAIKDQQQSERSIIGASQPMQEVYKLLGRVSNSDITVLITGESGTGKELIARAIHQNSHRLGHPFVALNCAAIPRELLESELFGFEKGAFTGATERKIGKFEQADKGTIFLDEIGDMPLELQAKLLRVIQEKEVTRTGGNRSIPIDVRIVAATNQDLEQRVSAREFREDLYYRLNVLPIQLPPLRERREDIPLLIDFFIHKANQEFSTTIQGCSESTLKALQMADWPGNVRQLENTIQRACLLSQDQLLQLSDFPQLSRTETEEEDRSLEALIENKLRNSLDEKEVLEIHDLYEMVLHQMERPLIRIILNKTRGNQLRTAEILGINRNTLRKKMKILGLDADCYKND
ncbi:MAG: sigma-54-dependent Fis family transcriptional regulator [Desulfuromonadaceae bacterium]|nr:sigma-54-dependent Fis family transcriptional regulator [Desulfuromonadaceae bacterium]